jgi:hypothetical protein
LDLKFEESSVRVDLRKNEVDYICSCNKNIQNTKSKVILALDYSTSMKSLYTNGLIQSLLDRVFPLAATFDDNEQLDVILFNQNLQVNDVITNDNLYDFTNVHILSNYSVDKSKWIDVAKSIVEIHSNANLECDCPIPTYVIFITDGKSVDKPNVLKYLTTQSNIPIYWQFLSLGETEFIFFKKNSKNYRNENKNVNFCKIDSPDEIDDLELYDSLLSNYPKWLENLITE